MIVYSLIFLMICPFPLFYNGRQGRCRAGSCKFLVKWIKHDCFTKPFKLKGSYLKFELIHQKYAMRITGKCYGETPGRRKQSQYVFPKDRSRPYASHQ